MKTKKAKKRKQNLFYKRSFLINQAIRENKTLLELFNKRFY